MVGQSEEGEWEGSEEGVRREKSGRESGRKDYERKMVMEEGRGETPW